MGTRERITHWILGLLVVGGSALVYLDAKQRLSPEVQPSLPAPAAAPITVVPPKPSAVVAAPNVAVKPQPPPASANWRQLCEQALEASDYNLARRCARLTDPPEVSQALLAAIDRAELATLRRMLQNRVNGLHVRAERAIQERNFPAAESLLLEAKLLLVNHQKTEGLRQNLDQQRGQLIQTISGHDGAVKGVAFNTDGTLLASGGDDQLVKIWETRTGNLVAVAAGHEDSVRSVAFSPAGNFLISGSDDRTARLWNASTGREIRHVDHGWMISCVAFSPGGHYFFTGGEDKKIKLWETSTGKLISTYVHGRPIVCLAVSPDGRFILSGGADGSIKLWQVASATLIQQVNSPSGQAVNSIGFSPDGGLCLAGGDDGTPRLYRLASGEMIGSLPPHKGWVTGVAFDPLGRGAYSVGNDRLFHLASISAEQHDLITLTHTDALTSLAVTCSGELAVTGDDAGKLGLWQFAAFGQ